MSDQHRQRYEALRQHARQIALLASASSLLEWDERTYMPAAASEYRALQVSELAGLIHDRWTAESFAALLRELSDSPLVADADSDAAATIGELLRTHQKKMKLPRQLVEEIARTAILGQQIWVEARREGNFGLLAPTLEKLVRLKREEADALGHAGNRYEALLDEYEPGESCAAVATVFGRLRDELVVLLGRIQGSGRQPDVSVLFRAYPIEVQERFARRVAAEIGFDFERGRLDSTAHPFCTQLGPHDVRLTTRYRTHDFSEAFFGVLHEAGHGLYEQGLPPEEFGLPLGEAVSLGIHESQSRMWENLVGRGRAFWRRYYPEVQNAFGAVLGDVNVDQFYAAVNDVRPSLIRTEADEVTYNLHVFVRFELEQALLADELRVADLPSAWNEKYRSYLGIEPSGDVTGVLQDIHWSAGAIGYFPTYSLGNLYAAQFYEQAEHDVGPLDEPFRLGDFRPLLLWLREKIHRHGRRYRARELVQRVTGRPLSHEPLIRHLHRKFSPLYELE
jgi:carboxypeptidase Taq